MVMTHLTSSNPSLVVVIPLVVSSVNLVLVYKLHSCLKLMALCLLLDSFEIFVPRCWW